MEVAEEKQEVSNEPEFTFIEAYEKQIEASISNVKSYIYKEPAIVFTVIYLAISIIGISYIAFVLLSFNVNVLAHVELSDFILSAIHHPQTLLVFIALFILAVSIFKLEALLRKKWMWYRRQLNRYHKTNHHKYPAFYFSLVIIIYLFVAAGIQAVNKAKRVKAGEQTLYTIYLSSPVFFEGNTAEKLTNVQIIANLSKHLWVYQKSKEQVFMFPHENVSLISPLSNSSVITDKPEDIIDLEQTVLREINHKEKLDTSTKSQRPNNG